jgi:hypothetical protein
MCILLGVDGLAGLNAMAFQVASNWLILKGYKHYDL